jgi:hypothetical protein
MKKEAKLNALVIVVRKRKKSKRKLNKNDKKN